MDANLSFLTTPTASPAVNGAIPAAVSGDAPPGSSSFAEVLTGEMFKAQRQAVAAPTLDTLGLQILPLGSSFNIITSDAPLPDLASLAVFARSQGLDEAAVQALFGLTATSEMAINTNTTPVSFQIAAQGNTSVTSLILVPTSAATTSPFVTSTATAFLPLQAKAWIQAAPLEPPVSIAATIAASTALGSTDKTMQSALRMTLSPADQDITKRLAQMSGNNQQSSWSALVAASALHSDERTKGSAWETLQLDIPEGLDLEASMNIPVNTTANSSTDSTMSNAPLASGAAPTGATLKGEAPNPQAMAEQRAAQYQQLADKLGEAVAQRLMAQIERGQWRMQMRMQPGRLGQIDIELKMHSGGLDAVFSSDNNVTRELLAQGSAKLRDTLSQSGMEVASVWINGDGSRKSGGNPTPGRNSSGKNEEEDSKSLSEINVFAANRTESLTSTGLNVFA